MKLIDERPQWLLARLDEYLAMLPPLLRERAGARLLKEARDTIAALLSQLEKAS